MRYLLCLLCSLCLCALPILAQSTNATISGGVTDPTGRLIPNAQVEVANDATGVVYSTKTNGAGIYLIPVLPPGHYHVQVSKPGFETIIKPDVVLYVQGALSLSFTLPVGAASESITVNASSSLLNTTSPSVSTVINRKFVKNIPLNGRSFQDLISLTPGVINQSPQYYQTQSVGGGGGFSVNGQRTQSNSVAHYGEQNGDLMRDPEMCFELRGDGSVQLDPWYYRNDYVGIEQDSRYRDRDGYIVYPRLYEEHRTFARLWDRNIRAQGFLEAFTDKSIRG